MRSARDRVRLPLVRRTVLTMMMQGCGEDQITDTRSQYPVSKSKLVTRKCRSRGVLVSSVFPGALGTT